MIAFRREGDSDLVCPACRTRYLVEVTPSGFQCWICPVLPFTLYYEIEQRGSSFSAIYVRRIRYGNEYRIGEVVWQTDKFDDVVDRPPPAFGRPQTLPEELLAETPCPIVFAFDYTSIPEDLAIWNPKWFAPKLYGIKEFVL